MHLPAALDALSQPVGLPPSLLSISDQIRQEDGPNRLQKIFKDVRVVSETCRDIIDSVRIFSHEIEIWRTSLTMTL